MTLHNCRGICAGAARVFLPISITIKYSWLLLMAVAALACLTVRNVERSRREAKECYELYLDVMATRKPIRPMHSIEEAISISSIEHAELKRLIRWRENQSALPTGNLVVAR